MMLPFLVFSLISALTSASVAMGICTLHLLLSVKWTDRATLRVGGVGTHSFPGLVFSRAQVLAVLILNKCVVNIFLV